MRKLGAQFSVSAFSAALAALLSPLLGQTPAFSINPMRMEMEVSPGTEKTTAFEIKAAPSQAPERGRLMLGLTDWMLREDGSVAYSEPGSQERSASSWIIFSPAALTLEPGRTQLVRITVNVPEKTPPGVYSSAIFVQERPEATPPKDDERVILLRVRYAFTLYVIVPPVSAQPELVNVEVDTSGKPLRLICELKNTGTRHVRPLATWAIRRRPGGEEVARGKIEATVLLPSFRMREPYSLQPAILAPGSYEVSVLIDFQDHQPLQSMTRAFEVAEPGAEKTPAISTGPPKNPEEPAPLGGATANHKSP